MTTTMTVNMTAKNPFGGYDELNTFHCNPIHDCYLDKAFTYLKDEKAHMLYFKDCIDGKCYHIVKEGNDVCKVSIYVSENSCDVEMMSFRSAKKLVKSVIDNQL